MARLRSVLLVTLGLVLGAVLGPPGYAAAKDAVSEVFVTNTDANPVPVTGSVAVTDPVSVTGSVGVAGTVDVADDREPFEVRVIVNLGAGEHFNGNSFVVPAGKRLVVEFVSASVALPSGQTPLFSANASSGALGFSIPLHLQGVGNGNAFWTGSMDALDFAPAGHYFLDFERQNPGGGAVSGTGQASAYIAGYLVPA